VDAAIAMPLKNDLIIAEILGIGKVEGVVSPAIGMRVKKSGRTTGLTFGEIRLLNAMVDVNYGEGRILRFDNQIVTTNLSSPGDSGSLVLNLENYAVGLLFAGSDSATIINPIATVLKELKVKFQSGFQAVF
jgi:hypothetical protein